MHIGLDGGGPRAENPSYIADSQTREKGITMSEHSGSEAPEHDAQDLALKLLHLDAEAATLRTVADQARNEVKRATARSAELEQLLEETENEAVMLKTNADAAAQSLDRANTRIALLEKQVAAHCSRHDSGLDNSASEIALDESKCDSLDNTCAAEQAEGGASSASSQFTCAPQENGLRKQLEAALAELATQKEEVSNLTNQHNVHQKARGELEETCRVLQDEASGLRSKLAEAADTNQRLETGLSEACQQAQKATNVVEHLQTTHKQAVEHLGIVLTEREKIGEEIESLKRSSQSAVDEMQAEADRRCAGLEAELDRQITSHTETLARRTAELAEQDRRIRELEQDVERLSDKLNISQTENDELSLLKDQMQLQLADERAQATDSKLKAEQLQMTLDEQELRHKDLMDKLTESQTLLDRAAASSAEISRSTKAHVSRVEARCSTQAEKIKSMRAIEASRLEAVHAVYELVRTRDGKGQISPVSSDRETTDNSDDLISKLGEEVQDMLVVLAESCPASEVSDLRAKLEETSREKRELETSSEQLRQDLKELADASERKASAVSDLVRETEKADARAESARADVAHMADVLQEQERATEVTLSALRDTIGRLENDVDAKTQRVDELVARNNEAARALSEALDGQNAAELRADRVEAEIRACTDTAAVRVRKLEEALGALQSQYDGLSAEHAEQKQVSSRRAEDAELEAERQKTSALELEALVARVTTERDALREALNALQLELNEVRARSTDVEQHLREAQAKLQEQESKAEALALDKNALENKCTQMGASCASLEAKLKAERETFEADIENVRKDAEAVRVRAEQSGTLAIQESEAKHKTVMEDATRAHEEAMAVVRKDMDSLHQEIKGLRAELDEASLVCRTATEAHETSKAEMATRLENAAVAHEKALRQLDQERSAAEELAATKQNLVAELDNTKAQLQTSSASLAEKQRREDALKGAVSKLENDIDRLREQTLEDSEKLKSESKLLREKLDASVVDNDEMRRELADITKEASAAKAELDRLRQTEFPRVVGAREAAEKRVEELNAALELKAATVAKIEGDLEKALSAGSRIEELQKALQNAENVSQARSETLDELQAKLDSAVDEKSSLASKVATLQNEMAANRGELESSAAALSESQTRTSKLEAEVATYAKRCEELEASGSLRAASAQANAEAEQDLFDALEKYELVLEKNNKLRKRLKRMETMLNLERKKTQDVPNSKTAQDQKRQVSPSSKGMSPSLKRARELMRRTPLAPMTNMATADRNPLGTGHGFAELDAEG